MSFFLIYVFHRAFNCSLSLTRCTLPLKSDASEFVPSDCELQHCVPFRLSRNGDRVWRWPIFRKQHSSLTVQRKRENEKITCQPLVRLQLRAHLQLLRLKNLWTPFAKPFHTSGWPAFSPLSHAWPPSVNRHYAKIGIPPASIESSRQGDSRLFHPRGSDSSDVWSYETPRWISGSCFHSWREFTLPTLPPFSMIVTVTGSQLKAFGPKLTLFAAHDVRKAAI